ncbi:MAG: flagellar basal body P-ring protein FlgI [Vicinamibacterales bacterium]
MRSFDTVRWLALFAAVASTPMGARPRRASRTSPRCRAWRPRPCSATAWVVGLNKTGDRRQTIFSTQSLVNMLERLGVSVPASR